MTFDTPFFLSVFLPVLALLHFAVRNTGLRNALLLAAGLLFYAFAGVSGLIVLLLSTVLNYLLSLLLAKKKNKALLAAGVAADLLLLGFYKYLTFFAGQVFHLPAVSAAAAGLAVPMGISFFLFKSISYLADVYRSPESAAKSFPAFLLYISFFPQITAGPISRFSQFAPQLETRTVTAETIAMGFRRFVFGLSKKFLLAYPMMQAADGVFNMSQDSLSTPLAWIGAIAYTMQIFFDFSAYSDLAVGLGLMFGIHSPENFDAPYIAVTLSDFWRRWHISLSTWFRDYLYIPLGGNRRGKLRAALNKAIVFTLCGFWHGAAWTFLFWGLWHGIFAALETGNIIPVKRLRSSPAGRCIGHIYTMLVVCIGFVLFRAGGMTQAARMLLAMVGFGHSNVLSAVTLHSVFTREFLLSFLIAIPFCLPLRQKLAELEAKKVWITPVTYAAALVLLVICLCAMTAIGFQPFIYAQF